MSACAVHTVTTWNDTIVGIHWANDGKLAVTH